MDRKMEEDRATHIKKLIEARDAVERQIDVLTNGDPQFGENRNIQMDDVLRRLRDTLRELERRIRVLRHRTQRPRREASCSQPPPPAWLREQVLLVRLVCSYLTSASFNDVNAPPAAEEVSSR